MQHTRRCCFVAREATPARRSTKQSSQHKQSSCTLRSVKLEVEPPSNGFYHFNSSKDFEASEYFQAVGDDGSLEHKRTRLELSGSAESGCQLCKYLPNSLRSRREKDYANSSITGCLKNPEWVTKSFSLGYRCATHYAYDLRYALHVPRKYTSASIPAHIDRRLDLRKDRNGYGLTSQEKYGHENASCIIDSLHDTPEIVDAISSLEEYTPCDSV